MQVAPFSSARCHATPRLQTATSPSCAKRACVPAGTGREQVTRRSRGNARFPDRKKPFEPSPTPAGNQVCAKCSPALPARLRVRFAAEIKAAVLAIDPPESPAGASHSLHRPRDPAAGAASLRSFGRPMVDRGFVALVVQQYPLEGRMPSSLCRACGGTSSALRLVLSGSRIDRRVRWRAPSARSLRAVRPPRCSARRAAECMLRARALRSDSRFHRGRDASAGQHLPQDSA